MKSIVSLNLANYSSKKVSRRCISLFLTLAIVFSSLLTFSASPMVAAATSDAPTQATYYVSPTGSDSNDGSQANPFKTLAKAKEVVRTLPKTGGDIVVQIADGFYPVDETLVFDKEDSGSATCTIRYEAAPGAKPVISGGEMLDKGVWTEATGLTQTGGLTAYKTTLNRDEKLRAIYVNDKRANMTLSGTISSGNRTTTGTPKVSFTGTDNPWAWQNGNNIPAAIVFSASVGLTKDTKNPQNIEAESLGGARWARPFVCFASAEAAPTASNMTGGTMLRFQMPYAAISQSLSNNTQYNPNNNQVIRNAFEFLNKRGDFYFDQAESTLYYIPLEGEDINTADVVIPKLETIVDLRGIPVGDRLNPQANSDAGRVTNITFDGLTFAHSDYKLYELTGTYTLSDGTGPVTTSSRGFASVQGCIVNKVYFPSYINWHETFYRGYDIPPAAVIVNAARDIKVMNGEIKFTGFNGIHLENDVKDIEVTGNYIADTLSSGVVVGHPTHIYENDTSPLHESSDKGIASWAGVDKEKYKAGTEAVPQDVYITNNFLYRNCYGFPGANSLTSFYTTNMNVLHNYLYDSTYGAMSIGWGWCEYDGFGHTSHGTNKNGSPYAGMSEDSKGRSADITTTSRNNKINYNRVEEICTVVNDSGAIYSLGRQGDPGNLPDGGTWDTVSNLTSSPVTDPNSNWYHENWTNFTEMNYNFLDPNTTNRPQDSNNWTNGFHPDEGSTFIKMIGNVVQSKLSYAPGQSRAYEFNNWKRKGDMIAVDGYVDGNNNQNGGPRITYNNYKSEDRIWPVKGNEIVLNSGLTDEYVHMIPKSLIADTEFELASNVILGKSETLNRRGLLKPEDTVWLAPANTTEFVEGPTMTKAAGDAKTINAPATAGEYKLYIVYGDGTTPTATSKYTAYVDTSASSVNVEDGKTYDVSAVRPLKLTLSKDYTYTLNDKPVENGYEISTAGKWSLVLSTSTKPNFKTINFTTTVSEANKLLTADVSVAPGGTVRFDYDLNDETKEIWLSSSSDGNFIESAKETKTYGDKLGMIAPTIPGPYVIFVRTNEGKVLSQSHARVVVRDMTPVDIPRDGLDLWLKADEGVKTDESGNVTSWKNMGQIPATLVPANVPGSGGDGLGQPNGNPKLQKDVYDYINFDAMSRPLKAANFKDYNGKTQMTIFALTKPTTTANNSSDQSGLVYFGLNENFENWAANDGWSGINLGIGTNRVTLRFGNAVAWSGGGSTFSTNISGLSSVRAQLNGANRSVYVNNSLIGNDTNSTALKGNRSDLGIGYTMSAVTPYRFLGQVAQILIYDRVLTDDEIAKVETYFNDVKAGRGGPANPVSQSVDKTLLTNLIQDVNNLDSKIYTVDSWNTFASALSMAQAAVSNAEIGQEEADNSYFALRDAYKALKVKPSGVGTALYGTPTLGGDQIDPLWDKTDTLPILKHLQMANGPANGTSKVLWDDANLYVLVNIKDPVLNSASGNAHEKDSVEIFVDETNSKASSYGTGMGQYRINYLNQQSFNPGSISAGFESYVKIVDGGYYIEAKIPFKAVVNGTPVVPKIGHVIGFDSQINDAGAAGSRQDVIMWHDETGNSWQNGSQWGVLTLIGEDTEKKPYDGEVIAPEAVSVKYSRVTLKDIAGYEYAYVLKDAPAPTEFTTNYTFTGLNPDTEYDFYQRVAETVLTFASEAAKTTIRTPQKPASPEELIPLNGLDVWFKADDANIVKDENNRVLEWANLVNGEVITPVNPSAAAKLMRDEEAEVPYNYINIDSLDSRLEGDILKDYNGTNGMTVVVVTQPTAKHNDFGGYGDKFSPVYINSAGNWGGMGITATTDGVHGRFGNGMGPWTSDDGPAPVVRKQVNISSLVSVIGMKKDNVMSVSVNNKDGEIGKGVDSENRRNEFKNLGTTLGVGGVLNDEASNRTEENAFKGRVAEIIIYDHALSVDELENINTYISEKYFTTTTPEPVDTTAPTWAEGSSITVSNITRDSVTLSWPEAQDNIAVTGYDIYKGEDKIASVAGNVNSYIVSGLAADTTYTFKIIAKDANSNYSETGLTETITTLPNVEPVDTTAPIWPEGSIVTGSAIGVNAVTLQWDSATDDTAVAGYEIYNGDVKVGTVPGNMNSYDVTNLDADTEYTFTVKAFDEAGNTTEDGLSVTITTRKDTEAGDKQAPTWPEDSSITAYDITTDGVTLSWSEAQDNVAVTGYDIYVGDEIIGSVVEAETYYKVSGLEAGTEYTFIVIAKDASFNYSETGLTVTITTLPNAEPEDTTAPTWPEGSSITVSDITTDSVTLSWSEAQDNVAVTGYDIYKGEDKIATVAGNVNSYKVSGLAADTEYTFTIIAKDASSNYSKTGLKDTITTLPNVEPKDTTAPTWTKESTLTASNVAPWELTLTWKAAQDDTAVTGYKIYRGSELIGTVTGSVMRYNVTGLVSSTSYTFKVEAGDAAGNWSTNGPSTIVTTSSVGGGGSTGGSTPAPAPTPTPAPIPTPAPAPVVSSEIEVKPVLTGSTAKAEVSADNLKKALDAAKADSNGNKTATLKVAEVTGAKNYSIELPKTSLTASGDNSLKIESPVGTVVVPSNMFDSKVVNADKVQLTIGLADQTVIKKEDVKQTVGNRPVIEVNAIANGSALSLNNPEVAIKVSLDYKPTAEELKNPELITVWAINGNGDAEAVTSGRYDTNTGKVTFTTNNLGNFAVVYVNKTFSDIDSFKWAKEKIEVMASKGIIGGTSETTFTPGNNITRADFMVLLVKALGLNAKTDVNFDDVAEGSYYYNALAIAKKLGITAGVGDNKFEPKANISRQDMMVLVEKAMRIAGKDINNGSAADIASYNDATQVSSYAQDAVAALVKEGIIAGSGNKLNPKDTATRAETAVIIYKLYNK